MTGPESKRPHLLAFATHPIQYQAPLFRALAHHPGIDFTVLFAQIPDAVQQGRGFGVAFQWDVPVLEGYRWERVPKWHGRSVMEGYFAMSIDAPGNLLRSFAPDAVLVTGWHAWPMVQILRAAHRHGIPVIMRGEANALRPRRWQARWVHRWLLGKCRAFLPIGASSRAFYKNYGVEDAQLFDTPYFIDNSRFVATIRELAGQHDELRAKWSIPTDATCILYCGKLEEKKRIVDLLDALSIAMRGPGKLHLLVVGTGELMGKAKEKVSRHGLPVMFAGFLNQSEIPSAYLAADVLALPSDYGETWGLVVNEAMACGRPAIVSDRVGCGPDLVVHEETGFTFPFGNVDALAGILREAARDPDRLSRMGRVAQARVLNDYTVERNVEGTLAALEWVTGRCTREPSR